MSGVLARPERPAVVVTGMGAVTPLGGDVETTWANLRRGVSGVRPIERFDASGFKTTFAAQIDGLPALSGPFAEDPGEDLVDRKTHLLLAAAAEAVGQARAAGGLSFDHAAVCVGSEGGRKLLEEVAARSARFGRLASVEPAVPSLPLGEYARSRPSHPTRVLAAALGARGPSRTVVTACTSAGGALAEALFLLRSGQADVAVAGGTDTLVEAFMVSGFSLLGALSERNDDPQAASRPFDLERDGFVLGEGAAVLVLETEAHAQARGATVLGRFLGAGLSNNAYRITDSPPDGTGPLVSMTAALKDAGLRPEQVGYVNAHGTSTLMNDLSESRGVVRAFGRHAGGLCVSSTKSMMGHLVAACGAVEAVVTLCSLRDGVVHGTKNLTRQDPDIEVDCVPEPERALPDLRVALSNSFGFGGSNATLALGKA